MYALSDNMEIPLGRSLGALLQRMLRSFSRFANQIVAFDIKVPRFFGSVSVFVLFFGCFVYGVIVGSYGNDLSHIMANLFGFELRKVVFVGDDSLPTKKLMQYMDLRAHPAMLDLNVDALAARLSALPFVESAEVQKVYPDTCRISLKMRRPYALWQHKGKIDVVDSTGVVIAPYIAGAYDKFPLVVGIGAADKAQDFLQSVMKIAPLKGQIRAYLRVADRRWDLLLNNGIRIKLPQKDPIKRLRYVFSLPDFASFLQKAVACIDLRLLDRITICPQSLEGAAQLAVPPQGNAAQGNKVQPLGAADLHAKLGASGPAGQQAFAPSKERLEGKNKDILQEQILKELKKEAL